MVPVFRAEDVRRAVPPRAAYDAVREAFVAYARGEWTMQPKVYVTNYPAGDFRAMPALGVATPFSSGSRRFPVIRLVACPR